MGADTPSVGEVRTFPVRTDRRPLDGSPIGSLLFDYAMNKHHGIENVRRRSVFAANDIGIANQYGNVTLELMLSPDTQILYHPYIHDSGVYVSLEDGPAAIFGQELQSIGQHLIKMRAGDSPAASYRKAFSMGTKEWYLDPMDPIEKITKYMQDVISWDPPNKDQMVADAVQKFEEAAKLVAAGYIATTVGQFNETRAVEVLIYNVTEYTGRCIRS